MYAKERPGNNKRICVGQPDLNPPTAQIYPPGIDNELGSGGNKHQAFSKLQRCGRIRAHSDDVTAKERRTGSESCAVQLCVCARDPGDGGVRASLRRRTESGFLRTGGTECP